MALRDGAEVCIALSLVEGAREERQGGEGPAEKGGQGTLRFNDRSGMSGFCVWGGVGRRKVSIGLCNRLDVVGFEGPMSHFVVDIQIYRETGEGQSEWWSVRT